MRIGALSFAVLFFCAGVACSNKTEPSAKQIVSGVETVAGASQFADVETRLAASNPLDPEKVASDTPDNVVKSWWVVYDLLEKWGSDFCRLQEKSRLGWNKKNMSTLLTPEALSRFSNSWYGNCDPQTWRRQIDEVKTESETRAVVFATIWSNTPPPADVSREEVESAKKGTVFKYVMEKSAGKWFLSDVLRFEPATSYRKERWVRVYEPSDRSLLFTGTVYHQ